MQHRYDIMAAMRLIDWTAIYAKYKGLWVALDEDNETVVGSGRSAGQALGEARSKGFMNAAITYVPREAITFAGISMYEVSVYEAPERN